MKITINKKRNAAVIRALCAVLAALVVLAITNFSVFRLLAGPKLLETVTEADLGTYTTKNIDYILDFYAEEAKGDDVTGMAPQRSKSLTPGR